MKRLNIDERMLIQACLSRNMNLTEIANRLKRDKSTISREVKNHLVVKEGCIKSKCSNRYFVCNICPTRYSCLHTRRYYNFKSANDESDNQKRLSRSKTFINKEHLLIIDKILIDEIRTLKQSLHHVYVSNPVLKKICSERTIRRLIYRNEMTVKSHELRKYCLYKHKYKAVYKYNLRDIRVLIGRQYKDYKNYVLNHKRLNVVQYDSVIGKQTDYKAILTITFPKYGFQFGLVVNKSNPNDVINQINSLFSKLGKESVRTIFPVNLTDNGIEFSRFNEIENWSDGEKICRCFYTSPYKATDKPHCERYHEYIRYFFPKSKTFNNITQDQVNWMFSQINSTIRKSLNDRTPYQLVLNRFGIDFLNAIGIRKVNPKEINLDQIL